MSDLEDKTIVDENDCKEVIITPEEARRMIKEYEDHIEERMIKALEDYNKKVEELKIKENNKQVEEKVEELKIE